MPKPLSHLCHPWIWSHYQILQPSLQLREIVLVGIRWACSKFFNSCKFCQGSRISVLAAQSVVEEKKISSWCHSTPWFCPFVWIVSESRYVSISCGLVTTYSVVTHEPKSFACTCQKEVGKFSHIRWWCCHLEVVATTSISFTPEADFPFILLFPLIIWKEQQFIFSPQHFLLWYWVWDILVREKRQGERRGGMY